MKHITRFQLASLPTVLALTLALAGVVMVPGVGHAASGNIYMITSNPEYEVGTRGFAGFLRSLGYSVVVGPGSCDPYLALDTDPDQANKIAQLQSYNLIIIHRNFGSGTLNSTATERGIWNKLLVPILNCNGPTIRNNTWRWYGSLYGSTTVPNVLLIEPPGTHPIVSGLTGSLFSNNRIYGGLSGALGGTDDGGTNFTSLARVNLPAFNNPICMAVWDEAPGGTELRSFWAGGSETYYRRRVYFEMHEYRNNALNPDPWLEVTANGRQLWADAVQYAMYGVVTPPPLINNLTPADLTTFYSPSGGVSFDAVSPLPIPDSGITLKLNGSNVSAGLVLSGPNTSRHAAYSGLLSNFVYNVEVTVSNATGSRTISSQFDTIDPVQAAFIPTFDGVNFNGYVQPGNYHVYLQVAANTAQVLTFHFGTSPSSGLEGTLNVPNTGGLDPSFYRLVPVSDALGNLIVLRLNANSDFVVDPVDSLKIFPNELIFAPAVNVPATLTPTIAQASPAVGASSVSPLTAIDLTIVNRDTTVVVGSITLSLGGVDVTGASTRTAITGGATVHYQPPVFLTPGATYPVSVSFDDNLGNHVVNQYSFQTRIMPAIPAAFATPLNSGANRGFNLRNHMAKNQTGVAFCNTADRAELQLEGLLLSTGGQPATNAINNTPYAAPFVNTTVINYGITNFNGTKGWFTNDDTANGLNQNSDQMFPGSNLVGPTNVAFEATAFLALKAGINRFGVKSSDGFKLTAGSDLPKAKQTVLIGSFDGSRGEQVPSEGAFLVYQDGLYAFRLLYFKGGNADVSLEWYSRTNDVEFVDDPVNVGDRTLINGQDVNLDTPTPAYQQRTVNPVVPRPILTVTLQGQQVVLSWNSQFAFQLQSASVPNPPVWVPVAQTPAVNGTLNTVTIPVSGQAAFYRLQY
jgi:hypothetical protein